MKRLRSLGSTALTVAVTLLAGSLFYQYDPALVQGLQGKLNTAALDLGMYVTDASPWQLALSLLGLISATLWTAKAAGKGAKYVGSASQRERLQEQLAFDKFVGKSRRGELLVGRKLLHAAADRNLTPVELISLLLEMVDSHVEKQILLPMASTEDDGIEVLPDDAFDLEASSKDLQYAQSAMEKSAGRDASSYQDLLPTRNWK